MNMQQHLIEAANLMLIGMVTVFIFLTFLIFAIKFMSRLTMNISSAHEDLSTQTRQKSAINSGVSPQKVAAISAAIKQYKSRH